MDTTVLTDEQINRMPAIRLHYALGLARRGFHFSPARLGATHGNTGWPVDATTDPEKITDWLSDAGTQLVMVAKFGQCAALDIDDWTGCIDSGFDPTWIEGMLKVRTPSGGFHIYLPWHAAFDGFKGTKEDAYDTTGHLIAELKHDRCTVTAPGGFRSADEKHCEGFYMPVGGKVIPCTNAPAVAEWLRVHAKKKPKAEYRGTKEEWKFHPDFETADFLDGNKSSLVDGDASEGYHEGSYDLVLAECPLCDKLARPNSTQTNFLTKFKFGGTGYGFICWACGVNTRAEFEEQMAEKYPDWEPWNDPIYRHDDNDLMFADAAKEGFVVERLHPAREASSCIVEFQKQMRNEKPPIEILPPEAKSIEAESTETMDYVSQPTLAPPVSHATVDASSGDTPAVPNTIILATRTGVDEEGDIVTRTLTGILASTVTVDKLLWLWDQRIPAGKITWLAGKPDCGKSLVLLDLIARTTTGRDWPDGAQNTWGAKEVLLAVSEDDLGDTVIPRLMAAGADLKRVMILKTVKQEKVKEGVNHTHHRQLQLAEDIRLLRDTLKANPNIAMVGIDPITGYFGDADPNKDAEIRPVMEAINRACENSGAAFVAVIHHNKRTDVDALQKILGASSVAGVSRAAWGFSRDPEDKELLRMSRIKGNLSKKRTGMKYHIIDKKLIIGGEETSLPLIEWAGECSEDADELQARDKETARNGGEGSAVVKALGWLKHMLKDGEVESGVLFKEADFGKISFASLRRAKDTPGSGISCQQRNGKWWWKLTTKPEVKPSRNLDDLPESEARDILCHRPDAQAQMLKPIHT